jgi:hypothetical protein
VATRHTENLFWFICINWWVLRFCCLPAHSEISEISQCCLNFEERLNVKQLWEISKCPAICGHHFKNCSAETEDFSHCYCGFPWSRVRSLWVLHSSFNSLFKAFRDVADHSWCSEVWTASSVYETLHSVSGICWHCLLCCDAVWTYRWVPTL